MDSENSKYRNVFTVMPDSQSKSIIFNYEIAASFERFHSNPPYAHDQHWHRFAVSVVLSSSMRSTDLYGVDMIEAEQELHRIISEIPDSVNDLENCKQGTTEQLCLYFAANYKLPDPLIVLRQVKVAECPERTTILNLEQ